MQKGHRIEFQTQITDFKGLEKEFSKSKHSGSIIAVDVYTDWLGSCKVVIPYFQKVYLESNESCPLSFLCLNSDLVLQSLENAGYPISLYNKTTIPTPKSQLQQVPIQKKTNLDDSLFADLISPSNSVNNSVIIQEGQTRDTLEGSDIMSNLNISNIENDSMEVNSLRSSIALDSSQQFIQDTDRMAWVPLLASVRGKSCPRFLFYKGGKLIEDVSGVNISRINHILKNLVETHSKEMEDRKRTENGEDFDQPLNDDSILSDRVNIDSNLDDASF